MRVLFHVGHPGHVHLFKNVARKLDQDHKILISAVDKEMTIYLLERYGLNYSLVGKNQNGLFNKFKEMFYIEKRLYNLSNSFKPDIMIGVANPYLAHVGKLLDIPTLIMDDTEHSKLEILLYKFFTNMILTPSCFTKKLGPKQLFYKSYHEFAYLHNNYFSPNPEVLKHLKITEKQRYVIIRLVSWHASHDKGQGGINISFLKDLIKNISGYAKIFITSERKVPAPFKRFEMKIPPEQIHDALYFSTLYIGEGATTASECALLGTPAIYVNPLNLGYISEQEKIYDLVYQITEKERIIKKSLSLLRIKNVKDLWKSKKERMFTEKIDLTNLLIETIESFDLRDNKIKSKFSNL